MAHLPPRFGAGAGEHLGMEAVEGVARRRAAADIVQDALGQRRIGGEHRVEIDHRQRIGCFGETRQQNHPVGQGEQADAAFGPGVLRVGRMAVVGGGDVARAAIDAERAQQWQGGVEMAELQEIALLRVAVGDDRSGRLLRAQKEAGVLGVARRAGAMLLGEKRAGHGELAVALRGEAEEKFVAAEQARIEIDRPRHRRAARTSRPEDDEIERMSGRGDIRHGRRIRLA